MRLRSYATDWKLGPVLITCGSTWLLTIGTSSRIRQWIADLHINCFRRCPAPWYAILSNAPSLPSLLSSQISFSLQHGHCTKVATVQGVTSQVNRLLYKNNKADPLPIWYVWRNGRLSMLRAHPLTTSYCLEREQRWRAIGQSMPGRTI